MFSKHVAEHTYSDGIRMYFGKQQCTILPDVAAILEAASREYGLGRGVVELIDCVERCVGYAQSFGQSRACSCWENVGSHEGWPADVILCTSSSFVTWGLSGRIRSS